MRISIDIPEPFYKQAKIRQIGSPSPPDQAKLARRAPGGFLDTSCHVGLVGKAAGRGNRG